MSKSPSRAISYPQIKGSSGSPKPAPKSATTMKAGPHIAIGDMPYSGNIAKQKVKGNGTGQ